jgi:hypothetical protein
LNLLGIITADPRLPSSHAHAFILRDGRCAAVKHAGDIRFLDEFPPEIKSEMWRALHRGGRVATHTKFDEMAEAQLS